MTDRGGSNPETGDARPRPLEHQFRHFTQTDLARRWRISPRTLERWRWERKGPPWLRVGGRVLYRIEDVLAYERNALERPELAAPPGARG